MPIEVRRQYLLSVQERYSKSTRSGKTAILNEFCAVCGYSRKYAIRILRGAPLPRSRKPGPRPRYGPEITTQLHRLWNQMNRMCSKKMVAALPLWLPFDTSPESVKLELLQMSASTIDRALRPYRSQSVRGLSTTRPSLIKNRIPIKLLDSEIGLPGYIEADTVSHCGSSIDGSYVNTLTMTDLYSGWTENRALWTKTAEQVVKRVSEVEKRLPFALVGFASDNGSEFLNEELHRYLRRRDLPVSFVRRRPYKKNDAAHVEQKNWTHVRELFGYARYDRPELVALMNEIYQAYWNPLWNYFTPMMKLVSKERIGGRMRKHYDKPKTPYERLMDCALISQVDKANLRQNYRAKNPFHLKSEMENKLKAFFVLAEQYEREKKLTGS